MWKIEVPVQHAFCVSIDFICSMYVRLLLIIMIPWSMYLLIKLSLSLLYQRLQCCLVISLYPHCCSAPYTFTLMPARKWPAIRSVTKVVAAWWVGFMFVCWQAVLYTIVLFLYTFVVCVCVPAGLSGGWWTGGGQVFGIASVDSAQFGDVFTSDWTFTMSYMQ